MSTNTSTKLFETTITYVKELYFKTHVILPAVLVFYQNSHKAEYIGLIPANSEIEMIPIFYGAGQDIGEAARKEALELKELYYLRQMPRHVKTYGTETMSLCVTGIDMQQSPPQPLMWTGDILGCPEDNVIVTSLEEEKIILDPLIALFLQGYGKSFTSIARIARELIDEMGEALDEEDAEAERRQKNGIGA